MREGQGEGKIIWFSYYVKKQRDCGSPTLGRGIPLSRIEMPWKRDLTDWSLQLRLRIRASRLFIGNKTYIAFSGARTHRVLFHSFARFRFRFPTSSKRYEIFQYPLEDNEVLASRDAIFLTASLINSWRDRFKRSPSIKRIHSRGEQERFIENWITVRRLFSCERFIAWGTADTHGVTKSK